MKFFPLLFAISCVLCVGMCSAEITADSSLILSHFTALTKTEKFRTYNNVDQLNSTANYIKQQLS
jgi:hypothetical protein